MARTRLTARRACVLLAGGWLALVGHGCASSTPPRVAAPPPAHLTIANVTDHAWRVVLRPKAHGQVRETRLAPREILALEIAGGAYAIEQAIEGAPNPAPPRRFDAEFAAGERYDWPLATVRSVADSP